MYRKEWLAQLGTYFKGKPEWQFFSRKEGKKFDEVVYIKNTPDVYEKTYYYPEMVDLVNHVANDFTYTFYRYSDTKETADGSYMESLYVTLKNKEEEQSFFSFQLVLDHDEKCFYVFFPRVSKKGIIAPSLEYSTKETEIIETLFPSLYEHFIENSTYNLRLALKNNQYTLDFSVGSLNLFVKEYLNEQGKSDRSHVVL